MNRSKKQVRIRGDPPGIPRSWYHISSLEKHSFRRFYPKFTQTETLLARIGVVWEGDLKTARLTVDHEGRICYEFSIRSGWEPTPNSPDHRELVSLIREIGDNQ